MIEIAKRWIVYIVAIVVLLFAASTCVNRSGSTVAGEKNVYEKQLERRVKVLKQQEKAKDNVIDSVRAESKKKDKEIARLEKENASADTKILELENKKQADILKASKNTYKESSEFIANTYDAKKSVTFTNNGVIINDSVPNLVVETIIEANYLNKKLYQTEIKLTNTEKEIILLNGKVKDKSLEIDKERELNKEKDSTLMAAKDFNKAAEKENKSLKRGRVIDKLLIVAAFVGGILIGK